MRQLILPIAMATALLVIGTWMVFSGIGGSNAVSDSDSIAAGERAGVVPSRQGLRPDFGYQSVHIDPATGKFVDPPSDWRPSQADEALRRAQMGTEAGRVRISNPIGTGGVLSVPAEFADQIMRAPANE